MFLFSCLPRAMCKNLNTQFANLTCCGGPRSNQSSAMWIRIYRGQDGLPPVIPRLNKLPIVTHDVMWTDPTTHSLNGSRSCEPHQIASPWASLDEGSGELEAVLDELRDVPEDGAHRRAGEDLRHEVVPTEDAADRRAE